MVHTKKMDQIAILWNKTKDPKYKEEWYKLIKECANGPNNLNRRTVSSGTRNQTNDRGNRTLHHGKLF